MMTASLCLFKTWRGMLWFAWAFGVVPSSTHKYNPKSDCDSLSFSLSLSSFIRTVGLEDVSCVLFCGVVLSFCASLPCWIRKNNVLPLIWLALFQGTAVLVSVLQVFVCATGEKREGVVVVFGLNDPISLFLKLQRIQNSKQTCYVADVKPGR